MFKEINLARYQPHQYISNFKYKCNFLLNIECLSVILLKQEDGVGSDEPYIAELIAIRDKYLIKLLTLSKYKIPWLIMWLTD